MKNFRNFIPVLALLCLIGCEQTDIEQLEDQTKSDEDVEIITNAGELLSDSVKQQIAGKTDYELYEDATFHLKYCNLASTTYNTPKVYTNLISIGFAYPNWYGDFFDSSGVLFEIQGADTYTIQATQFSENGSQLVYEQTFNNNEELTYFGITMENLDALIIFPSGGQLTLYKLQYGGCNDLLRGDTDGDGVPDYEDLKIDSNMEETVQVDGCDSSVENYALGQGYMLSDKMDQLEDGDYKNHGQFISTVSKFLSSLVIEGYITNKEKSLIIKCSAMSSIK